MKFERFIAKKFLPKDSNHFSGPLAGIATWSIALGVLVMIMSVSILRGFQEEISRKVVGFGSHIVIKNYEVGNAYEEMPISKSRNDIDYIKSCKGVKHVQYFANKGGMIKTDDQIHGIIYKGVNEGFDSTFFAENLVEGRLFKFPDSKASNEIIISKTIANKMHLELDDKVRSYFWQGDNYRARAFKVVGIYNTDLTEFDEHYIIGDLRQIQKLNGWNEDQVAGYEVLVDNFKHLKSTANEILNNLSYDLVLSTIIDQNPTLFAWLDLLDTNIILIIAIMAIVCLVAIISALLIMIFEKTSTIGILKTMGANNKSIRNIFLIKSTSIIAKGIVWGNAIAIVLCLLQKHFHLIKLDSTSYSMNYVPIDMDPMIFILISVCTIVACLAALLIPASYIAKISPAKTIKVV